MRPGWGVRDPALAEILASATPAASSDTAVANGTVPVRVTAYLEPADLPDTLVTSARCLVRVGEGVVVCTNSDGFQHPLPGGTREAGETWEETARREVLEETGWILDPGALRPFGWLHFEHLSDGWHDRRWPHPDALHVVFTASASERAGPPGDAWTDTQGVEVASRTMGLEEALANCRGVLAQAFLRQLKEPTCPL